MILLVFVACTNPDGVVTESVVHSAHTDTDYVISTFVPTGVDPEAAAPLVVLDGDWYTELAFREAQRARDRGAEPLVVVTVAYDGPTQRGRDDTPTDGPALNAGGLAAFGDALSDELLVDVPGDPDRRILFGHSLGGLAVTQLWLTRPELASEVIAASPSYWWDDGVTFETLAGVEPVGHAFLAAGSQEGLGMVALAEEMAVRLGDAGTYVTVPRKDHQSVVGPAMAAGLDHFLGAP